MRLWYWSSFVASVRVGRRLGLQPHEWVMPDVSRFRY